MKIIKEFKEFAVKGNAIDMSIGIVIGAAFTSIVNSLVKDVFTPILGLFTTGVNFSNWFIVLKEGGKGGPYTTLLDAQSDQAITLNLGLFINSAISFLIVAMTLFLVLRTVNKLKKPVVETSSKAETKECPFCYSKISKKAVKCPYCISGLEAKE